MSKSKKDLNVFDQLIKTELKENPVFKEDLRANIVLKPELQEFIPPLTPEELAQLEASLLAEGCRDALIVWENTEEKGKYILIDGHNRFHICKKHGLSFKTEKIDFKSMEEAKDWMINNQLGKRNMTEEQKSYYRGLQYKREKKNLGGYDFVKSVGQNVQATHKRLAEIYKVSPKTIQRDEKYAEAIDKLTAEDQELKWKILSRQLNIPKSMMEALLKEDEKILQKFRQEIKKTGELKSALASIQEPSPKKESSLQEVLQNKIITKLKEAVRRKDKSLIDELTGDLAQLRQLL